MIVCAWVTFALPRQTKDLPRHLPRQEKFTQAIKSDNPPMHLSQWNDGDEMISKEESKNYFPQT